MKNEIVPNERNAYCKGWWDAMDACRQNGIPTKTAIESVPHIKGDFSEPIVASPTEFSGYMTKTPSSEKDEVEELAYSMKVKGGYFKADWKEMAEWIINDLGYTKKSPPSEITAELVRALEGIFAQACRTERSKDYSDWQFDLNTIEERAKTAIHTALNNGKEGV